jgi:flagellar protein FlhE
MRWNRGKWRLGAYLLGTWLLLAGPPSAFAVTGSWVASVPGIVVAMSDRPSATQTVVPPPSANAAGRALERVQWRFSVPANKAVDAWLCHPQGCVELTQRRGTTQAFDGYRAAAPLHFRFRLPSGQRPFRVKGLQVIVNYQ